MRGGVVSRSAIRRTWVAAQVALGQPAWRTGGACRDAQPGLGTILPWNLL